MSDVTYRPSMVVNITLVFDERLLVPQSNAAASATPQLPATLRPARTLGEHLILRRGEGNRTFILNRVPKKASVDFRGHRQAATWNLTFDRIELPIDPRTVRAAAVEIHLGAISDADFAEGIQRVRPDGTRASILRTRTSTGEVNDDTLIMVGPVDKWSTDESSNGSEISLEGRDVRGLLLDSPLISPFDEAPSRSRQHDAPQRPGARAPGTPPQPNRRRRRSTVLSRLDPSLPIDQLVKQILYEHDRLRDLPVICDRTEWPDGVVPSPTRDSTRHRRGARGGGGAASGGASDMNYWDLITRYCFLVGAIPVMRGRRLYIRPARSLFAQLQAGLNSTTRTPFHPDGPRTDDSGAEFRVRRMVYGRDVEKMSFARKYAGNAKPKVVRAVSIDPHAGRRGTGRIIEAWWPPRRRLPRGQAELIARETHPSAFDRAAMTHVAMNGQDGTEEILNVPCYGITSTQRLRAVAESLYEEIGRQELEGSFETKNLASYKGDSFDPDLLRLAVGDAVELTVDARRISATSPLVTTLMETEHLPTAEVVERVRRRVGDENLARAIVASARGAIMGQLRYFRIAGIKYDWGIDSGVSISGDFHNYFTPRMDVGDPPRPRHRARPRAAQAPAGQTTPRVAPLERHTTPLAPISAPTTPTGRR